MIARGSRGLTGLSFLALAFLTHASPFGYQSPLADAPLQVALLSDQLLLNPSTPREYNLPTLTNNLAVKFDEDGSMIDAHGACATGRAWARMWGRVADRRWQMASSTGPRTSSDTSW